MMYVDPNYYTSNGAMLAQLLPVTLTGCYLIFILLAFASTTKITTLALFIKTHPQCRRQHNWKCNTKANTNVNHNKDPILPYASIRGRSVVGDDESVDTTDDMDDERPCHDTHRRSILQRSGSTLLMLGGAATANAAPMKANTVPLVATPLNNDRQLSWPLGKVAFSLLPLAGTSTRRVTIEEEVVSQTIWTHDQLQGIVNVNVPVRQTVVKLNRESGGGLWVHNPVAPTPQLLQMMDRLIHLFGPVRHIVLGSVALEHKATFATFASYYPQATVWLQPGQWSFPINVPIEFYGLVQRGARLRELPIRTNQSPATSRISSTFTDNMATTLTTSMDGKSVNGIGGSGKQQRQSAKTSRYSYYTNRNPIPEWADEIEYEILGPFLFKAVGGFSETAFYHKSTKSLIVTDCVVSVTKDPPPIISEDPRALLFHSRDTSDEVVLEDTLERRRKGWRHMVQFGLVFFPSQITVTSSLSRVIDDVQNVPTNLRNLGDGAIPFNSALYPWAWTANDADAANFDYISQQGTLFCPPILTKLILDREPVATLEFVNRVCERFHDMRRIIPCHLNNNIIVRNSNEFYHAFDMLRSTPTNLIPQRALAEDLALLQKASDLLTQYNIIAPSAICDGEPARQIGRFALQR